MSRFAYQKGHSKVPLWIDVVVYCSLLFLLQQPGESDKYKNVLKTAEN